MIAFVFMGILVVIAVLVMVVMYMPPNKMVPRSKQEKNGKSKPR
jgi:hypothetical protein